VGVCVRERWSVVSPLHCSWRCDSSGVCLHSEVHQCHWRERYVQTILL